MEQVFWQLNRVGSRSHCRFLLGFERMLAESLEKPGWTDLVDKWGSTLRVVVLFNKVRYACFRGSRANEIYK